MAELFIKKLKLFNFKTTADKCFDFKLSNIITGENGVGKSSIGEGIVFGLYGLTMNGSDRCDPLIKTGAKKMAVEITFIGLDEKEHVVQRVKSLQRTAVKLDGKASTQEEVDKAIGIDRKIFLSIFNNKYLSGESLVSPSETRKFVTDLLTLPDHEEILQGLDKVDAEAIQQNDAGENYDISHIADKLKELSNFITVMSGNKSELSRQISELSSDIKEFKPEELAQCDHKIAALKLEKNTIKVEPPPAINQNESIEALEKQLETLGLNYKLLKTDMKSLPKEPSETCNECLQILPKEKIAELKQKWNKSIKDTDAFNKKINIQLEGLIKKGVELKAVIAEKKAASADTNYQQQYDLWEKKQKESTDKLTSIEQRLSELFEKRSTYMTEHKINERLDTMKVQLEEVLEAIDNAQKERELIERLRDAYKNYFVKQSEIVIKSLNKYFNKTSIRLFEANKSNGKMNPVFKILYNDTLIPFLSTSEVIRLGLELSKAIIDLTGIKVPRDYPEFCVNLR